MGSQCGWLWAGGPTVAGWWASTPLSFPLGFPMHQKGFRDSRKPRTPGAWGSERAACEELALVNSNIWYLLGVPSRKMPPGSSGSWLLEPREKMLHGPLSKGRRSSAGGGESGVSWPAAPPAWGAGGAGTGTWEQGRPLPSARMPTEVGQQTCLGKVKEDGRFHASTALPMLFLSSKWSPHILSPSTI